MRQSIYLTIITSARLLEQDNAGIWHYSLTMEQVFSRCTRLHDTLGSQSFLWRAKHPHPLLPELNLDVPTADFLSAESAFTYAHLYGMLGNEDTVAWLTPHAAVARESGLVKDAWQQLRDESYRFFFHCRR
jgi:hypothetical protein